MSRMSVKRQFINGREHLVVPLSLINEGVLNGSKGALFYPREEFGRNPAIWNGVPLTVNHPTDPVTGEHLSASDSGVLDRQGIGFVLHAWNDGKLRARGAIDVERARKLAPDILNTIQAGRPVELSTGLYTDNEPAKPGSHHNGKPYDYIARNYRSDHVAILTGAKGACSIADGCGVLVNQTKAQIVLNAFHDRIASPRHPTSGRFLPAGSGIGSGPVHDAAKEGHSGLKSTGLFQHASEILNRSAIPAARRKKGKGLSRPEATFNELIANSWSDAARAAAIEAKRAHHMGDRSASADSKTALRASEFASRGKTASAHLDAAKTHRTAAVGHQAAAIREAGKGNMAAAIQHSSAALAHQTAADEHALIGRQKSTEFRPVPLAHLAGDAAAAATLVGPRAMSRTLSDSHTPTRIANIGWSDAARKAALEARRASSTAAKKSSRAATEDNLMSSSELRDRAKSMVKVHSSPVNQDHYKLVGESHAAMAAAHWDKAAKARSRGSIADAAMHATAAAAHQKAAAANQKAHDVLHQNTGVKLSRLARESTTSALMADNLHNVEKVSPVAQQALIGSWSGHENTADHHRSAAAMHEARVSEVSDPTIKNLHKTAAISHGLAADYHEVNSTHRGTLNQTTLSLNHGSGGCSCNGKCAECKEKALNASKHPGNPQALRKWFNDGAGGKIDWTAPGARTSCYAEAEKHMTAEQAHGFCQERAIDTGYLKDVVEKEPKKGKARNSCHNDEAIKRQILATSVLNDARDDAAAKFVLDLLHGATSAHLLHLGTDSFAQHMALDELYKELPAKVDDLAEAWQGSRGKVLGQWRGGWTPPTDDPLKFVEGLQQYVKSNRAALGPESQLQNLVDEIAELLDGVAYRIRELH